MKRGLLFVLLACVALLAGNSRTADTLGVGLLSRPMSVNEFKREMYDRYNALAHDVDTAFAHLGGVFGDSLDKNFITVDTLSVTDSAYVAQFVADTITADSAQVGNMTVDTLTADSAQVGNLTADTATLDSLYSANVEIAGGAISGTNVTVGAGKTLNVSAGTLTLANNQISGDKVEGGTIAAITITVGTIGDSLYVTDDAVVNDDFFVNGTATVADLAATVSTLDSAYIPKLVTATSADFTGATVTFDNNAISGDKVEGGTIAATTITVLTVGDSLYVTDDAVVHDDILIEGAANVSDSLGVGGTFSVGGGDQIDSMGIASTDSMYISFGGTKYWFTPTSTE